MTWMIGLSILLFWLPFLGGLIAGFVGGRKAGRVPEAILAVLLPGLILGILTFLLGGILGGIPVIGQLFAVVANMGAFMLSFMNVIPLLIGAILGALTAK
jgi:hypothetical protein